MPTRPYSHPRHLSFGTVCESLAFLLVTTGIGGYWASAGSGRVAAVGLALVFVGDTARIVLKAWRGPQYPGSAGTIAGPSAPFIIAGFLAHDAVLHQFGLETNGIMASGVRAGAALYALAILWAGPPRAPTGPWGRILGLEAGAAQALFLGIPLGWLLRPATLAAGSPKVGAVVSLLSGAFWFVVVRRLTRRRGLTWAELWPASPALAGYGLLVLISWTLWRRGFFDEPSAPASGGVPADGLGGLPVRLAIIGLVALVGVGATLFWGIHAGRASAEAKGRALPKDQAGDSEVDHDAGHVHD